MDKKVNNNNNLFDQKDVRKTIQTIAKNWYWFVLFISMGIGGSVFYLFKSTTFHGAAAEILIKPPKDPFKDALSETLPRNPKSEDVNNEIKVLTSTHMIDETIKKMGLDVSYFIEGRLKTGQVYKGTPFEVQGKIIDYRLYDVPIKLNIVSKERFRWEIKNEDFSARGESRFGEPVVNNAFSFLVNPDTSIINRSNRINETTYQFRIHDHREQIIKYKKLLKAEPVEDASVINVRIEDEVPERAVEFLNNLINLYIENSVTLNKQINENTLEFIDGQLSMVENQLNGVESNLEAFQRERTTFDVGAEQGILYQRAIEFESEKDRINIKLKSINVLYEYLTSDNSDMAISPAILEEQDPTLANSFQELFSLQQKKTNLLFSNTASSPLVRQVNDQIGVVKQNIMNLILKLRQKLTNDINSLNNQIGEYRATMRQMPSTQRGIVNISRNQEIYSKIYQFLLETRAQTIIAKAGIVPDKILLEPAYNNDIIRPVPVRSLAAGIGIGLALALLTVFIKGVFYNYINTKDELKDITSLPIIGVIGKSKEAATDYMVVEKFPQSKVAEAFRVIRTNLSYFSPKSKSKVLLVTSSVAGEGKTFCAVNIATTLAKAKKKVILIDLDLHKPKQANAFNLQNDVGVTSYVVGNASLNQVIKDTPTDNLQVILTGPRTPNPSELIVDPMMEQLIEDLKNHYEFIIIDTPPVGLLSDAMVFMKHADLNIYVVKAGYSKKDFVDIAHQLIEKNDIRHLSFILNSVNSKNIPAGYGGGYYA